MQKQLYSSGSILSLLISVSLFILTLAGCFSWRRCIPGS